MWSLHTPRLRLRHFTLDDADFILQLLNQPGWLRFIGDRGVHTHDDARAYLQNGPMTAIARLGFGLYAVEHTASGRPIGMCGLLKRDTLDDVDIGFAFLAEHCGQGYGREAATAVMAHAREHLHLQRLLAITAPDNTASIALLQRLGFTPQRRAVLTPGQDAVLVFECRTR